MTPSRAVFRQLFYETSKNMDTYDYLPDADAKYPFCFVDYGTNDDQSNSDLMGSVAINVHWFGTRNQAKQIDTATAKLHDQLLRINSFLPYHMHMSRWRDRPMPESPDAPGILHFIAEIGRASCRERV